MSTLTIARRVPQDSLQRLPGGTHLRCARYVLSNVPVSVRVETRIAEPARRRLWRPRTS